MDTRTLQDVSARWAAAMRRGDWEAAWRQTDRIEVPRRRAQRLPGFARQPHQLVWDGTPFAGRSVLVRCEHGLGDTLQFSRFLPRLAATARTLHVMAQPPLVGLLRGLPGTGQVHDGWQGPDWPAHEVEIEVMELAYALRAGLPTLPPPLPGLAPRSAARTLPLPLPQDGRLRIGLVWSASDWDTSRSIPLDTLAALVLASDASFYGLQQGAARDDPGLRWLPITPLSDHTTDLRDAAAALLQLDLLVCVDGMPAHLAGSLDVPVWVLLKHDADWRWMERRSDSPWYPSMRLFRQTRAGDWHGVVQQAVAALAAFSACARLRRAAPNQPPGNASALAG